MRHARAYGTAVLAIVAATGIGIAATAFAQSTTTPLEDAPPVQAAPLDGSAVTALAKTHWGDAQAGVAKAAVCAACHGVDGNPAIAMYPRIAGMPERYTAHQLALYKSGQRQGGLAAVMSPMAMPLSAQDMRDVGAYFATQRAGAGIADDSLIAEGPNKGLKFYEVGQNLFRHGDVERGIPACMACHGPTGSGNPGPAYPHIGGQQSAYVVQRLNEYRTGTTEEQDPALFNMMATVSKSLTDDEIQSLGSYLQGLHPRSEEAGSSTVAVVAPAPAVQPAAPVAAPAAPAPEATPADGAPAGDDAAATGSPAPTQS